MSKKLQGNGLWESSRMMLPQHKEQSMSALPQTAPPTKKEFEMMRKSIILPVVLNIVEKKSIEVEMSSQTLKPLYSAAAKVLANTIRADVQQSKKDLVERNIRVFEDGKDDSLLYYRYVCRGHKDRFMMTKDFMRDEISMQIGVYAKNLIAALQKLVNNNR
ncbi:hypothetical protein ABEX47_06730 [Paenibacillus ehimensis]|uniref:hypothetical protein n=1 Tax=Paenibacillus ehimensis TaxID=79264 RepID=UPI000470A7B1|nr:hypothetical protein [Paenibacillus ehimensis]MEC0213106.1 hypothetical protein [Paenibacillus ehimensis]